MIWVHYKRTDIGYGNGTRSHFDYDINQRLEHLATYNEKKESLQDIIYTFDSNSNIKHVENRASKTSTSLGGQYIKDYTYDDRNWLVEADGNYENKSYDFYQEMQYDLDGKMMNKISYYRTKNGGSDEENQYQYIDNTHQIEALFNRDGSKIKYEWDLAGNLISMEGADFRRVHKWNVYNQLSGVFEEGEQKVSYYLYDESGDRTCKLIRHSDGKLDDCVLYPSPFIVATTTGYTKHYYEGSDHLLSSIGRGGITDLKMAYEPGDEIDRKQYEVNQAYEETAKEVSSDKGFYIGEAALDKLPAFTDVLSHDFHSYYYHKDYLGSSAWITDENGIEVQYLDYLPWGESFVNEDRGFQARYTFTGKELDKETGYQYFGARYNEPARLGWLSVDPLSDKSPSLSPYVYCANNPVNLTDPDGRDIDSDDIKEWKNNRRELRNILNGSDCALQQETLRSLLKGMKKLKNNHSIVVHLRTNVFGPIDEKGEIHYRNEIEGRFDEETGKTHVYIYSDGLHMFGHEVGHAIQVLLGEWGFESDKSAWNYDKEKELDPYQYEHAIAPYLTVFSPDFIGPCVKITMDLINSLGIYDKYTKGHKTELHNQGDKESTIKK